MQWMQQAEKVLPQVYQRAHTEAVVLTGHSQLCFYLTINDEAEKFK